LLPRVADPQLVVADLAPAALVRSGGQQDRIAPVGFGHLAVQAFAGDQRVRGEHTPLLREHQQAGRGDEGRDEVRPVLVGRHRAVQLQGYPGGHVTGADEPVLLREELRINSDIPGEVAGAVLVGYHRDGPAVGPDRLDGGFHGRCRSGFGSRGRRRRDGNGHGLVGRGSLRRFRRRRLVGTGSRRRNARPSRGRGAGVGGGSGVVATANQYGCSGYARCYGTKQPSSGVHFFTITLVTNFVNRHASSCRNILTKEKSGLFKGRSCVFPKMC